MKTARDLVSAAMARIKEAALDNAEQAIREVPTVQDPIIRSFFDPETFTVTHVVSGFCCNRRKRQSSLCLISV